MDDSLSRIIILVVLVILSAFFSATETAFFSANKIRLKSLAGDGNKRAKKTLKVSENLDSLLSTILIGNNLVNIGATAIATTMFIEFFNGNADLGSTVATVVTTVVVLMFGEITPKGLAKNMPERFAMFATPAISVCMVIFKPINLFISLWQKLVYKIFKVEVDRGVTEEELITMVEEAHQDGEIDQPYPSRWWLRWERICLLLRETGV